MPLGRSFPRLARRILPALLLAAIGLTASSAPADAYVYFRFGVPFWGAYYYPPAYPYYAPGYAYPAPAARPAPPAAAAPATRNCRDYTTNQTIDGRQQSVTGTACQQPDGSWRIVR